MPMEKTFNAAEAEPRIYAAWEKAHAFAAGANASREETFSIMIPPPNVTGSLHVGHAFNNTVQDILTRWKRMQGYDTLWQPGQDHAGIATQLVVERKLAEAGLPPRAEMTREAFLSRIWEWKAESGDTIINQLKRLGASCDWDRNAFTMSGAPGAPPGDEGNFHDAVIKVFVEMFNHKDADGNPDPLIYRGKRLVNWDPHFETAISDLEVENVEVAGFMWHFKYPLAGGETYDYVEKDEDGNEVLREVRDYISIATTRPETMLGDGAVAVHPTDARYSAIVGKLCEIPVGPKDQRRLIPIITDEYPDPTFGSGAVKITGAHDFNDYAVAQRAGIPMYALMDTKARMRADGGPYEIDAREAKKISEAWLVKKGYLKKPDGFWIEFGDPAEEIVSAMNLVPEAYRGLDRFEARARVVADITDEGLAVMVPATDPRLGKAYASSRQARGEDGRPTDSYEEGGMAPEAMLVPLVEPKPIMQPFGDRSKVVIEPMLTDQWFVDTAKIVGPALDALRDGRTTILPESGEKVYFHWLENIEPWCISRQLWWGHRIPVWYGPDVSQTDVAERFQEEKEKLAATLGRELTESEYFEIMHHHFDHLPTPNQPRFCGNSEEDVVVQALLIYGEDTDVLFSSDAEEQFGFRAAATISPKVGGRRQVRLSRDPDVLDTWFSSGLWPIGTLGWPEQTEALKKYFPTSVLVTGQDILFFWVARMMMMQLAVVGEVPFHTVYLHQLVRDEKGEKMSKTRGNVIDPLTIIDQYGADALRFTMAQMAAPGGVLKLSEERIKGYRNFGTKLWNACRFAEMNGVWEGHATSAPPTPTATVNRWIVGEAARVRADVDAALTAYRFNDAANALYAFVWGQVCDWYVEFAKPLFDGDQAGETRETMAWVLDQCMILLHPIMPFITEELWQTTGARAKPLIHTDWPDYGDEIGNAPAMREMTWVTGLIEGIRSARAQVHVPAGMKVPLLRVGMDDAARTAFDANAGLIARLARIASVEDAEAVPKGAVTVAVEGGVVAIPLEGVIDIAEEKARLTKTLEKLRKDMGGLSARLANPNFVSAAKPEVVEETREKLALAEEETRAMDAALARLSELL